MYTADLIGVGRCAAFYTFSVPLFLIGIVVSRSQKNIFLELSSFMTPRITAVIALRIVAFLIMIWALSDLIKMAYVFLSSHSPARTANPIIAPSFDRTQIAAPPHRFLWSGSPIILMRFAGGLVLFSLSKPLGKFIARGME